MVAIGYSFLGSATSGWCQCTPISVFKWLWQIVDFIIIHPHCRQGCCRMHNSQPQFACDPVLKDQPKNTSGSSPFRVQRHSSMTTLFQHSSPNIVPTLPVKHQGHRWGPQRAEVSCPSPMRSWCPAISSTTWTPPFMTPRPPATSSWSRVHYKVVPPSFKLVYNPHSL